MNIFRNASDFIGEIEAKNRDCSLQHLFNLIAELKSQLGKKGYLLNSYLSLLLEAAGSTTASDATDWAFQKNCEYWRLCHTVIERNEEMAKHPLYAATRKAFLLHDEFQQYQEEYTQKCLLYVVMANQFMEHAVSEFLAEKEKEIDRELELLRLHELFQMLAEIVGDAKMEQLNENLKKRFISTQPTAIVTQGLTDELIATLTTRDLETDRMTFQLATQ